MRRFHPTTGVSLVCLTWLGACSRESPKPSAEPPANATAPAAPAPSAATPATPSQPAAEPAPAPPTSAAAATAGAATEKHQLRITNYAKTPVSVSLNGEWVGQWDDHITVPIERVAQGKNSLTVDIPSEPTNELKLDLQAERGGNWVSLLALNFKGKTGSQTIPFVAK